MNSEEPDGSCSQPTPHRSSKGYCEAAARPCGKSGWGRARETPLSPQWAGRRLHSGQALTSELSLFFLRGTHPSFGRRNSPSREGAAPPRHRGKQHRGAGYRHGGQVLPAARAGEGAGGGAAEVPAGRPTGRPRGGGSRGEHGYSDGCGEKSGANPRSRRTHSDCVLPGRGAVPAREGRKPRPAVLTPRGLSLR